MEKLLNILPFIIAAIVIASGVIYFIYLIWKNHNLQKKINLIQYNAKVDYIKNELDIAAINETNYQLITEHLIELGRMRHKDRTQTGDLTDRFLVEFKRFSGISYDDLEKFSSVESVDYERFGKR